MGLTTVGRDRFSAAIIGDSFTAFNNANAHLGVGNGTTAFNASQTDLVGASKTRKAMDATYPSRATNVLTFRSTYGSSDGNHAWDEVGVFNAASAGDMLCRVVQALGSKSSGTWTLTHTVTVSAA